MEYLKELAEQLLPIFVTIVSGLVPVIVAVMAKVMHKKFGVEVEKTQQEMLSQWVTQGIGYAEQWALQQVKNEGPRPTGPEKMTKALEYVTEHARRLNLDTIARDRLRELVEAQLGNWYRASAFPPPPPVPVIE